MATIRLANCKRNNRLVESLWPHLRAISEILKGESAKGETVLEVDGATFGMFANYYLQTGRIAIIHDNDQLIAPGVKIINADCIQNSHKSGRAA